MSDIADVSDSAARCAAQRVGLVARKSHSRRFSDDNQGDFMLVDPSMNVAVAGWRFDMTAAEVVEYCRLQEATLFYSAEAPTCSSAVTSGGCPPETATRRPHPP